MLYLIKKNFFYLLPLLAFIVWLAIVAIPSEIMPEYIETCKSNLSISNGNVDMKMLIMINFFNGHGVLEIKGYYSIDGNKGPDIRRQIFFNYVKKGSTFMLTSNRIENYSNEKQIGDITKKLAPDFFLKKGTTLVLDKASFHNGGKVFKWSGLPVLYCISQ